MAGVAVKLTGDWNRLREITSFKGFSRRVKSETKKAIRDCGKIVEAATKKAIRSNVPPPLSPLTVALKHRRISLRETFTLVRSIKRIVPSWNHGFVGFLDADRRGHRIGSVALLARTLNDGDTIPVTQKMRNLFRILADADAGKISPSMLSGRALEMWERAGNFEWKPLAKSTTHIIIPPRPFFTVAFKASIPGLRNRFALGFIRAIDLQHIAAKRRATT